MTFFTFLKIIFRRFFWHILIFFVVVLALIIAGYFFRGSIYYLNNDIVANSEGKELAKKVGELVFLPQDEVPTVAKVSNPDLLKDQAFFADAKVGDVVLIYTNAKKAVLYDPVANKIVNMSSIGGLSKVEEPQINLNQNNKTIDSSKENQF